MRNFLKAVDSLEVTTIVEGIESRDDLDLLKSMGIPYGQGFLWGRPEPVSPQAASPRA